MCQGSEGPDEDVEAVEWGIMAQDKTCWKKGYRTPGVRKKSRDHIHVHEQLGKRELVWSCSTQDFTGNSLGKHHWYFPNLCAFSGAFARALAKQTPWIRGAFRLTQDRVIPIKYKNKDSFWYKMKQTLFYHIHLILSLLEKSGLNFKACANGNHLWSQDLWCYLKLPSASSTNSS